MDFQCSLRKALWGFFGKSILNIPSAPPRERERVPVSKEVAGNNIYYTHTLSLSLYIYIYIRTLVSCLRLQNTSEGKCRFLVLLPFKMLLGSPLGLDPYRILYCPHYQQGMHTSTSSKGGCVGMSQYLRQTCQTCHV